MMRVLHNEAGCYDRFSSIIKISIGFHVVSCYLDILFKMDVGTSKELNDLLDFSAVRIYRHIFVDNF